MFAHAGLVRYAKEKGINVPEKVYPPGIQGKLISMEQSVKMIQVPAWRATAHCTEKRHGKKGQIEGRTGEQEDGSSNGRKHPRHI